MRIFNLPRAGGKTMRMLYASEFQKVPILCRDQSSKASLMDKAGFWGIKIQIQLQYMIWFIDQKR